jgi:hypothetical protein
MVRSKDLGQGSSIVAQKRQPAAEQDGAGDACAGMPGLTKVPTQAGVCPAGGRSTASTRCGDFLFSFSPGSSGPRELGRCPMQQDDAENTWRRVP